MNFLQFLHRSLFSYSNYRFNGHVKHFVIMFDDTSGLIYIGDRDKGYEKLEDLVQSGLITMYLDQKAGPYIDLMCDLTHFNNQRNQHASRNGSRHHHQNNHRQHHSPSSHSSLMTSSSISRTATSTNGTTPPVNGRPKNFKLSSNNSPTITTSKHHHQQHSPSPSVSSLSRCSVVSHFTLNVSAYHLLNKKSDDHFTGHFLCSYMYDNVLI